MSLLLVYIEPFILLFPLERSLWSLPRGVALWHQSITTVISSLFVVIIVIIRLKLTDFVDTEDKRFLLVPESLKLETLMPKKLGKGKHLLLMKIFPFVLSEKNLDQVRG